MARGIYKIINIVSNSFYIGSAVNLQRRKARHFSELRKGKHNNRHLQRAWDKYGEQAFVFVVLEEPPEHVDLLECENVWLRQHVGQENCYNIGVDATAPMRGVSGDQSPTWGRKRTPEELAAQNWLGRTHTDSTKEKIAAHLRGKPKSAEVRAKISAKLSGEGNYWYGKTRPDHGAKVQKAINATSPGGVCTRFDSIAGLRQELALKPSTVNNALKSGKPLERGPKRGWRFAYAVP